MEAAKREGVDLREEIREGGVQDKSGVVRVLEGSREWISREGVWKSESKREVMKDFRKGEGEGSQRIASMNLGCGILWILGGSVSQGNGGHKEELFLDQPQTFSSWVPEEEWQKMFCHRIG